MSLEKDRKVHLFGAGSTSAKKVCFEDLNKDISWKSKMMYLCRCSLILGPQRCRGPEQRGLMPTMTTIAAMATSQQPPCPTAISEQTRTGAQHPFSEDTPHSDKIACVICAAVECKLFTTNASLIVIQCTAMETFPGHVVALVR